MVERALTPTRLACLRLVEQVPGLFVPELAHRCAPRGRIGELRLSWSSQGAARMGGKLAKALENRGLVRRDQFVDCGVGRLYLTPAGVAALKGLTP